MITTNINNPKKKIKVKTKIQFKQIKTKKLKINQKFNRKGKRKD